MGPVRLLQESSKKRSKILEQWQYSRIEENGLRNTDYIGVFFVLI